MSRRAPHRLRIVFSMVLSLLFSQLASANYVCPMATEAGAMAEMASSGIPCDGMDEALPALCQQHATGSAQALSTHDLPPAALPVILLALAIPAAAQPVVGSAMGHASVAEARPPPDPLFLTTLRLRV